MTRRSDIEQACISLSHAFAYHLDQRDYGALADLFAPEGVWIRHGKRLKGREQILEAMQARPATQFTRHITTNVHITRLEGEIVRAVVYNISLFNDNHDGETLPIVFTPENQMMIEFGDMYGTTPQGWRILERDTRPIFVPQHMLSVMAGKH